MGLVQPIMTWGLNTNMRDQGLHFIYVSISILLQTQTDHLIVLLIILNSTQWIHTVYSIKVKYLLCLSLPLQAQRKHWKLLQQSSSDALSITILSFISKSSQWDKRILICLQTTASSSVHLIHSDWTVNADHIYFLMTNNTHPAYCMLKLFLSLSLWCAVGLPFAPGFMTRNMFSLLVNISWYKLFSITIVIMLTS